MALNDSQASYDILIIGSGIVGLILANKLGNSSLQVGIIDQAVPELPVLKDALDLRVSVITPAAKQVFADLNIWQQLPEVYISVFDKMHVWTAENSYIDFASATIGEPALGYIVANKLLQAKLYQQLQNYKNISFIAPAKLQAINSLGNNLEVITSAVTCMTQLLVGADGANSWVRALGAIESVEHDYQHSAIVATVTTELSHQQTAWQCFLPGSILAMLPLKDVHACSIVWSVPPATAEQLLQKNADEFCLELSRAFAYRLGSIKTVSKRLCIPLRHRHAKQYIKANIALVGDAAHTIHPLAGQGLNLGILDANCLAKIILAAAQKKRLIGSVATLRKYERARRTDNLLMFMLVDGLKYLFNTPLAPVKWLGNTGLTGVNHLNLIKNYLMKQAISNRDFNE